MDQLSISRTQFLSFLNTDFNNFESRTPLDWLNLYNVFYPDDTIEDNYYYDFFDKEKILKYFKDLNINPSTVKLESGELLNQVDNSLLAQVYFHFIQARFRSNIDKIIQLNPERPELAYPFLTPIPAYKLGKIIITNSRFDLSNNEEMKFSTIILEKWECAPENFEILIWRLYYKICKTDFSAIKQTKCCKICNIYFFSNKNTKIICSLKKCKNKQRENLRTEREK